MDVNAYLDRIGYNGATTPTLSVLRALHLAHLKAVPFENLDIHLGRPIGLNPERLFEKIVASKRGGFCYELNGLFAQLLRALGYDVTLLSARVAGKEQKLGPEFDHLTLRVDMDGAWLADVGFGDCFLEPLRLQDGYQSMQAGVGYRLLSHNGEWALMRRKQDDAEWQLQYVFTLIPRKLQDFAEMCVWHQTSPNSHFTRTTVCTRVTEYGRITLSGDRLIITERGTRTERQIGADERRRVLLNDFGIEEKVSELTVRA